MPSSTPASHPGLPARPGPQLILGVVAHVDAGKTSLTERLLFESGALEALGGVDEGTTRTDSMDLERRRGITIRAAVASLAVEDLTVTIVDTPGHPDFIAEVERSLTVLDAAVLVLSSVEGVQPQSVVIWRALRRVGVPAAIFVNKVDRAGSDVERVVDQVRRRLTPDLVVLARPSGQGRTQARVDAVPLLSEDVVEAVAATDPALLERWADGAVVRSREVREALRRSVRRGVLTPVVCGSAITGAGVGQLRSLLYGVLPRTRAGGRGTAATVFAVDHDASGRRSWVRLWDGQIRLRDRLAAADGQRPDTVTGLSVATPQGDTTSRIVHAGQVAAVRGLRGFRVGDAIGRPPRRTPTFAPPTLQATVEPVDPAQRSALFDALTELADEDPLIGLRIDEAAGEAAVSLHGPVQREVIAALLEERYGVPARFGDTAVRCVERVVGAGSAVERVWADGNPYLATVGLRVEPGPLGSGVRFCAGLEPGRLVSAFVSATEEGVRSALEQGLHGWAVEDCVVTMTESRYLPRQSHAHQRFSKSMSSIGADFRRLAPVVVMTALARAGTVVCEPVERFQLELPDEGLPAVMPLLGRLGAVLSGSDGAHGYTVLSGELGSVRVPDLARRLPDLTGGEGVLMSRFDHHSQVTGDGPPPARRRTGVDPRDRLTWFREMPR